MAARRFGRVGVLGVTAAALLLASEPLLAQKGGGGGRGGGGGGSRGMSSAGMSRGGGVSYAGMSRGVPAGGVSRSGTTWNGNRFGTGNRNFDRNFDHHRRDFFFPGFFGFYGLYAPWYYPWDYFGYVAPSYYVPGREPFPILDLAPTRDTAVHMRVMLPASDAEVWFEGQQTQQTGTERDFDSPELMPGKPFIYEIRAHWKDGGRETDQTRKLTVYAGQWLLVDFTRPPPPERVIMPRLLEKAMPKVPE
jgi:uncharacterized protein (TIGR03000 family)